MSYGQATYPIRSTEREVLVLNSLWTAGGTTLNMTKVYGKQITSVVRTADGLFTVTFPQADFGTLIGAQIEIHDVTTTDPLIVQCTGLTYNATVTAATSTVAIEFSDLAGVPAIPPAGAKVTMEFKFALTTL